jgi:hypothetical protein
MNRLCQPFEKEEGMNVDNEERSRAVGPYIPGQPPRLRTSVSYTKAYPPRRADAHGALIVILLDTMTQAAVVLEG